MTILAAGLLLASIILLGAIVLHARRWTVGRPAKVDWVAGIQRLPRAYLHDVHDAVSRERLAGAMHAATAGGLLAVLILLLFMAWGGWRGILPASLLLIAILILLGGAMLVARRRWPSRPARFSGGRFQLLPLLFLLLGLAALLVALPEMGLLPALPVGQVPLALILVLLAGQVAWGPLKHILAGTLHLAAHPRSARFGAALPVADLAPLDLAAPKLGVSGIADFAWNRLLGFDACIQCGRCEAACPANAAGQPLNPKALIQDFVAALPAPLAEAYSGSPHPPLAAPMELPPLRLDPAGRVALRPETIWACTTCRACVRECPMMIEHVDAIVDLRRHLTLEEGATPAKAADALAETRAADNPGGRRLAARLDWAADLAIPRLTEGASADVLLWLGDSAFELRGQRTLRSLVRLLRRAELDFAVLGAQELDCGDLARRLGDEALFQDLARRNVAILGKRNFRRIVTADPHALHCLKNEYPAFGGHYEVLHHSTVLAALLQENRLAPARKLGGSVTYHDPCYLGRYNGEVEAPRLILDRLGVERVEMERARFRSFCCGGGGGAALSDIPGRKRIPDLRMEQARATGAATVAVACPNCAAMLEGVVGPRPAVADLAELLEAAL
jgi:Fe-S oxidoreductase